MRSLKWFGLGLLGLAVAAAPSVQAQPPAGYAQVAPAAVKPAKHQHKGLFASRHCVECQRAYVKKHDGVDIPPPPSMLPAGVVTTQVVHQHGQVAPCAACEAGGMPIGPVTVVEGYPAGHASVGGPQLAGQYAPGHAVVGGPEPVPVGVARAWQGQGPAPRMAAAAARTGSYDPTVMPTSAIPAQTAIPGGNSDRPHVLSHMLGIGGVTRHARQVRAERKREAHAAIAYDDPSQPVTALPASAVYGKGH